MSRKNPIVSVIYRVPITLQSPFLSFFAYTAQATFLWPPPVKFSFPDLWSSKGFCWNTYNMVINRFAKKKYTT